MLDYLKGLRLFHGPVLKTYLLLTAPLLFILIERVSRSDVVLLCLFSAHTFLYLWFGWAVNDYADRELDLAAGKKRTFGIIRPRYALTAIVLLFAGTLLAGAVLYRNSVYVLILCIGLVLGIVYSVPPFRLKGRGFWSLVFGPGYGKIIPIILATLLFYRFEPWILVILLAEGFKNGLDLFFHQIRDVKEDSTGGVKTFAVVAGLPGALRILRRMTPVKIIAAGCMGLTLAWFVPEYRFILAAIVLCSIPAWFFLKRYPIQGLRDFSYMTFAYTWFGEMVFSLSPLWLGSILAIRYPPFIPFLLALVLINLGLARYYQSLISQLNNAKLP